MASSRHGAFYEKGEYITIIFSPIVTKSYQNELAAIKTAGAIRKAIIESNHSSVEKIALYPAADNAIAVPLPIPAN